RGEWGFGGYVVSDCWAISDIYSLQKLVATQVEAAAMALSAGTDLNCGVSFASLAEAVRRGLVPEARLDTAVGRLLAARFRLGMFDPPARVPWARIPYSVNDSPEHRALALETARKSMVLLKNDGGLLPLSKDVGTVAVLGPNADDVELLLGNYNGFPSDPVTPLRGIREKVSPGMTVLHAPGSPLADELPVLVTIPASALRPAGGSAGASGLHAEYFANPDLEGAPSAVRTDEVVDFRWWGDAPMERLRPGRFSVRWTGTLVPPTSGRYAVGGKGLGDFRVFLDDSLVATFSSEHEINTQWTDFDLEGGRARRIRVEYRPRREDGAIQLVWSAPAQGREEEALRAVASADVVVMVMGLSPRLEGEEMRVDVPGFGGGDRTDLSLPAAQQRLMERVVAAGKPVVLVLLNGSA
ncbi:MAG TPA: glycoside hydrolase family 3 C-terminal domain-containing protein, partial [Longimicrobiales bacterium]|nr:glycoside hydrolase family 3 C-terminal domain-containing protein [Longimicrobiales bacterium]